MNGVKSQGGDFLLGAVGTDRHVKGSERHLGFCFLKGVLERTGSPGDN